MKTFKNIIAIFAFVVISIAVNAQPQFGLKVGLNSATQNYQLNGISSNPGFIAGFLIGAIVNIPLNENYAIQPGLQYSQKGAQLDNVKDVFNYIEFPINFMLKANTGLIKFFSQAGPVFSYASNATETIGDVETNIRFKEGGCKRFDFGLGFGGGFQISNIQIAASYTIGMSKVCITSAGTIKNRVFGVSLIYLFKAKE